MHHVTPQQEDWGSPNQGIGYAPPPPPTLSLQLQQQQQLPLHLANDSVGERTPPSLNGHGQGYDEGQTSGGDETESVSSPLDEIKGCTSVELDAVATGAQEGLCEARTSEEEVVSPSQLSEIMTPTAELANGAVSLFLSAAVDSSITAGASSAERSRAPLGGGEEVGVAGSPEPSEEQCGGGLADPGRPEGPLANDAGREDDDAPLYPRPTDGQSP